MPFRYLLAVVVAITIITAGFIAAAAIRNTLLNEIRRQRPDAQGGEALTEDLQSRDGDTMDLAADFGLELTPEMLWKLRAADLLTGLWFIWAPVVLLCCLGVAALSQKTQHRSATSEPRRDVDSD